MNATSIMDQSERRIATAHAHAQATRTQIIESMREEIGRPHYAQAKAKLEEIQREIQSVYLPFIHQVASIEARSKHPLPHDVRTKLHEIGRLCETIPRQVRAGIDGWNQLAPSPKGLDGQPDIGHRASVIHGTRQLLRCWDGILSHLRDCKSFVEAYIQESKWPAAQAADLH